jgi:hypothetical protein
MRAGLLTGGGGTRGRCSACNRQHMNGDKLISNNDIAYSLKNITHKSRESYFPDKYLPRILLQQQTGTGTNLQLGIRHYPSRFAQPLNIGVGALQAGRFGFECDS